MKKILSIQLVLIPILYIITKLLWGLFPLHLLPEMLKIVLNDLIGPVLLMYGIYLLFINFLWKTPVIGKLSQIIFQTKPNIQGTWRGTMHYEWEGKKEKTVFLVIKQSDGYSLNVRLLTDERTSSSMFAEVILYRGIQQIIYTYSNEEAPDNKERNPSHEGFCQLDFIDLSNNLQGIYYTTRKTFGKLIFNGKNKKIVLNFEKAKKLFGISE